MHCSRRESADRYTTTQHISSCIFLTCVLQLNVAQGSRFRSACLMKKHFHPQVITCLSVCYLSLFSLLPLSLVPLLFLSLRRVLCPELQPPCDRDRRALNHVCTCRVRSIASWDTHLLEDENKKGFLQKTYGNSRAQSGTSWWLDHRWSQSSLWSKWITQQSPICNRGAGLGNPIDPVVSVQNQTNTQ